MTLWSYGDSHAAGHELGTFGDLGEKFLMSHFGVKNRTDYIEKYGNEKYKTVLYPFVSLHTHGRDVNPHLSYAGELSKILLMPLRSRAVPGCGMDHQVALFFEDLDSINSDDVVLFTLSSVYRYYSENGRHTKLLEHPYIVTDGPCNDTWKLWRQGLIILLNQISPCKIIFVETNTDDSCTVKEKNFAKGLQNLFHTGFINYAFQKPYNVQYPLGHIHEDIHKEYSNLLYEEYFK